jgi:hypothetical protein
MSALNRRVRGLITAGCGLLRYGRPSRVLLFGPHSFGDDLLCTTVLHEARRRGRPFGMMTRHPELFLGNADPSALLPVNDYYVQALRRLGGRVVQPYYAEGDRGNALRDIYQPCHILTEMCRLAGISGDISLRPYLHLSSGERRAGQRWPRQITVHSSCGSAAFPFTTKEWGAERFASVARELTGEFKLIQIGAASDPPLSVDLDLRGRTSLREAAAILAASEVFVGLEGFLTHLARAVDCPAVVIFGGRVRPETLGYGCNINLDSTVACAPCGLRDGCPNELACMKEITPNRVVTAVRSLVAARLQRPLRAETALVSTPVATP